MFTQLSLASSDVGFSNVKTYANGTDILFPSVVVPGRERVLANTLSEDRGKAAVSSLLDKLHVVYQGREYYVGLLGLRNGGEYNWSVNRLNTIETRIAFLTSLALTMIKTETDGQKFVVVTGLPIEHYRNPLLREEYERNLTGQHELTLVLPDGRTLSKEFFIVRLRVLPQGLGCFYDVTFGEDGEVVRQDLLHHKHLLVDVGFRTIDVTTVEDFEPVDLYCYSLDNKGIKTVLENMLEDIKSERREDGGLRFPEFNKPLAEMEQIFLERSFFYDGQVHPVESYANKWLKELAWEIENSVNTRLGGFSSFHNVFLSGGGAVGLFPFFSNPRTQLTPNAQFANCHGFYKVAYRQLKDKLALATQA